MPAHRLRACLALLDQPGDAWRESLAGVALGRLEHFAGQLRRPVPIGIGDLRCFMQTCLFLGLLRWVGGRWNATREDLVDRVARRQTLHRQSMVHAAMRATH